MQLSDYIATVNSLLDENGIRRPEDVIIDTLNEGYYATAMLTQACELTHSRTLTADSYMQTLPVDFYAAISVYAGSTRLWPIRLADLDDLHANWVAQDAGSPLYYSIVGAMSPLPQLWLFPRPSTAATLKLTYAGIPVPMTYDADTPQFPREHHYTLVRWAYAWELLKERSVIMANKAFQVYLKFVEDINELQQYVYRRTPDRDWMSPPLDAEAIRKKMMDLEPTPSKAPATESQVLAQ